mmetsp:Transcript_43285/g.101382  ORF Transcript_43285/g.101382 Transcript_43285/m.101382 type:complete len:231 (-) Transcript_43285:34-726(-)
MKAAAPKSMILSFSNFASTKQMFSSLRSRWTTPLWCRCSTPSITCAKRRRACSTLYAPEFSTGKSMSPLATSCVTSTTAEGVLSTSINVMTLLCGGSARKISTSARSASTANGVLRNSSGLKHFSAHTAPLLLLLPSYTTAVCPTPSSRPTRYTSSFITATITPSQQSSTSSKCLSWSVNPRMRRADDRADLTTLALRRPRTERPKRPAKSLIAALITAGQDRRTEPVLR